MLLCRAVVQAGLPSCHGQCSGGLAACSAIVFVMAVCSVGNVVRFVGAAVIAYVAVWQFHICRIAFRYVSFHNPKRSIFFMCFSQGCGLWLSCLPEVVHVFSPYCPQSGVGLRTTAVECCFAGLSSCPKLIAIKLCAISEKHAKVRRESVAGYATDETLVCGPKEHTRWWQRYRGQLQGLLYRLILNSYL